MSRASALGWVAILLRRQLPLRDRHRAREGAAHEEALVERLAHVPHLAELLPHVARADGVVVAVERPAASRDLAALERRERRLGGEPAGLDRVVHALEARHVDEPRALPDEHEAGRVELRGHRVEAALRDRLGAPRHALAAPQDLANEPVRLELLEEVVRRELDVGVLEPDDEPDRDVLVPHRVDPRPAELAVAARSCAGAIPSCGRSGGAAARPSRPPSRRAPRSAGCGPGGRSGRSRRSSGGRPCPPRGR